MSSPDANLATYQVMTRISVAATMFGTAVRNFCSMSLAGREIASICSASSAAISDGMNTKMKTIVPATREIFTVSASPICPPSLSAPAAARRFVTSPRSTFASSQPTKPMMPAPTMFGTIASSFASISCTGSSRPRSS